MKVRFQADADLNDDIVKGVLRRDRSIDFRTATQARLHGLSDVDVLALAARDGRILVSHDRRTLPRHFSTFLESNASPGVLIVSQREPVAENIEDLFPIWSASEAEEWVNLIWAVPF